MKPLFAALLLGVSLSPAFAADVKLEPIFNGKDLAGWSSPEMEKFWRVEDGVLVGESSPEQKGHYLWTEKSYGDFVLEFEVRWTGEVDTGVEFRVPHIQLQLGVSRSLKRDMSGSLYTGKYPEAGQAKNAAALLKPFPAWNHYRLEAKGAVFKVAINGQPAVSYSDEKFVVPGPLGLQLHQGVKMKVEYRNLRAVETPFELPPINTEVPLAKIKEICAHYRLHALWAKIEKDPPRRPFKSDGCTGWFDDWRGVSLYPAGFLHDLKYWAGYPGEDVERLIADAELMTDVARLLKSTTMAETMFHGVRVGGAEQLEAPFSWGFGRAKP